MFIVVFIVAARARLIPAAGEVAGARRVAAAALTLPAMVAKLVCGVLGALVLAATAAQATEAMTVADRAGFLIGHAQRCGVAEDRLEHSAKRIGTVIAAFASDAGDREAAQARFAEGIAAAALAQLLGDKLPSCAIVRSTLAQFEGHRHAVKEPEGPMARDDRQGGGTARHAASAGTTPGKAAKRTGAKRADLSAERRAALQLRRAAQQTRGNPPSS